MKSRCMLCGKPLDEGASTLERKIEDEYDDDVVESKPSSFCLMCQAKLKNEADKGQKDPKPM